MTQPHRLTDLDPLDRMAQNLISILGQANPELPHDIGERLRVARRQALALRKLETAPKLQVLSHGNSLTLVGSPAENLGLWGILGSAIPVLALLVGLATVQSWDSERTVSELAEIDTALLVDDLPPAAYSDPGFIQFLRQNSSAPHEE